MQRGHVTGMKKEHKQASDWYKTIEAEHIRRIEAAWQATHALTPHPTGSRTLPVRRPT